MRDESAINREYVRAYRRLKKGLREADEDTRYRFAYWVIGLVLMAGAIVFQFGYSGVVFCIGISLWAIGNGRREA